MKRMIAAPLAAAILMFFGQSLFAERGRLTDTRAVVDQTLKDLRSAADFERHKGKQTERYENAAKHLSDFDKEYTKGHFDKGKLDDAIDDLKNVVEHNTLEPSARDALSADLRDLRQLRADRK
jgi:hypothetical protein